MRQKTLPLIVFALLTLAGCQTADTEQAAPMDPACAQKPDSGMCRAAFTRYYFDQASGACRSFIWGGCGGTVPFETMEACQSGCQAPASGEPPVAPVKQSLSF